MRNHIPNHIEKYVKLEDCLNLKRLTRDQKVGLPLELAKHNAFHILQINDNPNNFFDYASNQSTKEKARIDNWFKVRRENETHFFVFEDKNHKDDSNFWSPSWIQEEVFDRSHKDKNLQSAIRKEKEAGQKVILHKMLVCSHFKGSRRSKWLMNECGWRIVELGFQVTKATFKKAIGILVRKLYWIKKNFFDKPIQKHLTSYNKSNVKSNNSVPVYSIIEIPSSDIGVRGLFRRFVRDMNECITANRIGFSGYG